MAETSRPHPRRLALLGAPRPCRPPAVSVGAQPDRGGVAGLVCRQRLHRGRDRRFAGLAGQRDPSARLRDRRWRRRPATPSQLYLRTSPEFACKKLLAAGERRIVEFARVFRNRERGALHHPEFTLIEWYRAGEPYETLMDDCAAILALRGGGGRHERQSTFRGRTADPFAAPERLTVAEAFTRFAGIDLLATLAWRRAGSRGALRAPPRRPASASPPTTAGAIFSAACWSRGSRPSSASAAPTILDEYPAGQAALARPAARPRAWPSGSSFMPAASSSPTASAN